MIGALLISAVAALTVEQVHIASGASPSSASITWSTRFNCSDSQVRIGRPCESLYCFTEYFSGSSAELTTGNNTQFIHKVNVLVEPSTTYTYEVGCSAGWSKPFTMRSAKQTGPNTFVVFGDLSTAVLGKPTWEAIRRRLSTVTVDAIIHVGDIAYDLFTDDSRVGDDYMNTIQSVAAAVPYMVIAGNHEEPDDYQNYNSRFAMPSNNFYHTYTIGLVRFVGFNTESIHSNDSMTQATYDFLASTLNRTAEDKAEFPWLVVMGHRPLYCNSDTKSCQKDAMLMRQRLESLLYNNAVDLYINGHVHNYQRTTPVYNGTALETASDVEFLYLNPKAPIYITTGGAGTNEEQTVLVPNATLTWYVTGTDELSYSIMSVYNSTHLKWEQWFSEANALTDEFWVVKQTQES